MVSCSYRPPKDPFYDLDSEDVDKKQDEKKEKNKKKAGWLNFSYSSFSSFNILILNNIITY